MILSDEWFVGIAYCKDRSYETGPIDYNYFSNTDRPLFWNYMKRFAEGSEEFCMKKKKKKFNKYD